MESRTNPRRHFDKDDLAELVESIRTHGILTPLLARPVRDGERLEIVAGARRFRAAAVAGLEEIPVQVRDMTDKEALEAQVIENLQRADVHPLDEGLGYRALAEKLDLTVPEIAERVGKSASYVYQRLKLADLTPALQEAFLAGTITAGHAILLARLQPKAQVAVYAEAFRGSQDLTGKWGKELVSVRALAGIIRQEIHQDLARAPWKKDDEKLYPKAGSCIACPKRTGFEPALFPDVGKRDECTDPPCFQEKMRLFIEGASAGRLRLFTRWQQHSPKGTYKDTDWIRVTKKNKCPDAQEGIILDGEEVGQVVLACVTTTCKVHRGRARVSGPSDQRETWRQESRAREEKCLFETKRRWEILKEVAPRAEKLADPDLRLVASGFWNRLWHDAKKDITRQYGWEVEKKKQHYGGSYQDFEGMGEKKIAAMSRAELGRFLVTMALWNEVVARPHIEDSPTALLAAAKAHKVDVKKISRRIDAERKEKAARRRARARKAAKK